jgi:MSHA biogenesis protein MshG
MQMFKYQGRTRDGDLLDGNLEASSLEGAINELTAQGITIIHVMPAQEKNPFLKLLLFRLDKPKVKTSELLIFCRQMHTLTKAGISMAVSIKRLAEISRNPTLIEALNGIERNLLGGQTLASGMQRYPHVFSRLFVELIKVGEETGSIDEVFAQMGDYFALDDDTLKRFKTAFRYPLIVMFAVVAGVTVINIFVIPNFAALYDSFHTPLPTPTLILLSISKFMRANWAYLLAFVLLTVFTIRTYLKTAGGRYLWDRYQLKLPVVGSIIERVMLSRFARTLAIVFRTGIPLNKGILLVANSIGNTYGQERVMTMQQQIDHGEGLSSAAANTKLLSPLVLQMIAVGEETGVMDAMLTQVADFYDREIDYDLQNISDKLAPILLVVVAGMVLMLAIAVFLPMWDIYQFAQGQGH